MKGKLTKKRYRCATVFINHYSHLRFIHLQVDNSSVETVAAKHTFKNFAAEHGIKIQHHHCNNGRFSNNAFKQGCHNACQQLTFCGVNAHFKNGIAKRSTRNLSESTHKQLLHARACWGRQFTLCCGNMPCAMLHSSTIVCQCWRMAHQG